MNTASESNRVLNLTMEAAIRLSLVAALAYMCVHIVLPFALPVVWGVILAIALWPLCRRLTAAIGGRQKLAATLLTLLALAALLVPSWLLAESAGRGLVAAGQHLSRGDVAIPAPPDKIDDWPLIGKWLGTKWDMAVADPPAALRALKPQIVALGERLLSTVAGLGLGVLFFALSLVLAGVFMATAQGGARAADALACRLVGDERGSGLVEMSAKTVSSVVQGVLGVAAIQAVAATLGMIVAGVPGAAAWGLLVLLLAIVQLPPLLVLLPIAFYVSTTTGTVGSIAFLVWALIVSVSDSFLKPLFLGRGVEVPMLVILIGAIGGMLAWGVLGLFVGAVVLAVGYQLARAWFLAPAAAPPATDEPGQPAG